MSIRATALKMAHMGTPSNPPANSSALYFKSDGKLYKKSAAGVEEVIEGGGGGGGSPSGPAGGDLTGSYPNPTIKSGVTLPGNVEIQGNFTLGGGVATLNAGTGVFNTWGSINAVGSSSANGQPYMERRHTSTWLVPNGDFALLATNSTVRSQGGVTLGTSGFVAPMSGIYMISGSTVWGPAAAGRRVMTVYKNGAMIYADEKHNVISAALYHSISHQVYLSVGDTLGVYLYQNCGSGLTTVATDSHRHTITLIA